MTTSLDIEIFLKKSGLKNFDRTRLKGDASSRRYERVTSQNQNAILMITPQAENKNYETSSGKTKNRESMGYSSLARLAGNKVEAFLFIFPFVVTDLRMVLLQSTNSDCKPYPPHLKAVLVLVQEKIQVDSGLNQKMKS